MMATPLTDMLELPDRTILLPSTFEDGFTQSEISLWDHCAEKWYLGYNLRLGRKGAIPPWHFVYGDGIHLGISQFYRDGSEWVPELSTLLPAEAQLDAVGQEKLEYWQGVLGVQLQRYYYHYRADLDTLTPWLNEETVTVDFEGIKLTGKIDLGFTDDATSLRWLQDHKSGKSWNQALYEGWHSRFQFMFYVWLYRKATGEKITNFRVNFVRKPSIKVKVNESFPAYFARLQQDMIQQPESYFIRRDLNTLAGQMERFEDEVLRPKLTRIHLLTEPTTSDSIVDVLVRNKNTGHCDHMFSSCPFKPVCQNKLSLEAFNYEQRDQKHQELEEGDAD